MFLLHVTSRMTVVLFVMLGCVTKNNLSDDSVEVGVGWSLHSQVPGTQLVDCLYNNLHYTDDSMFGDILASTRLELNYKGAKIRSMSKALKDTETTNFS
jgi:hypothetical protein